MSGQALPKSRQEEEHEPEDVYLENAIKQVNGRPTNYGPPLPNGNGRSNGRSRSLLKSSIPGNPVPIAQLQEPQDNVVVLGEVVSFESRPTRTGKILVTFDVYDGTDTIGCKAFLDEPMDLGIKRGKWVIVRGNLQFQMYDNELALMVNGLAPQRPRPAWKIAPRLEGWNCICTPNRVGWMEPLTWNSS